VAITRVCHIIYDCDGISLYIKPIYKPFMRTSLYIPGMLRGKCTLHDPGDLHDPFAVGALLNHDESPRPVTDGAIVAKKKKRKMSPVQTCAANECSEEIKLGARNDCQHPLCEHHKREPKAYCADGAVVCFCFYCNKTHDASEFIIKKNICDRQYLRRKERSIINKTMCI